MWRPYFFFKFSAAPAQEYTDLEKYFSQSGNNTELTETYSSCLAKGELLVCKVYHDQVSAEQKLGLTKVRPYLFLMLINRIAPTLTVPNRTVIPEGCSKAGRMRGFSGAFAGQLCDKYYLFTYKIV